MLHLSFVCLQSYPSLVCLVCELQWDGLTVPLVGLSGEDFPFLTCEFVGRRLLIIDMRLIVWDVRAQSRHCLFILARVLEMQSSSLDIGVSSSIIPSVNIRVKNFQVCIGDLERLGHYFVLYSSYLLLLWQPQWAETKETPNKMFGFPGLNHEDGADGDSAALETDSQKDGLSHPPMPNILRVSSSQLCTFLYRAFHL